MKKSIMVRMLLLLVFLTGVSLNALAQRDKIEGLWYNAEKTAKINIYKGTDGKFWGKIVWLKEPEKNGKPKVDENNPKAEHKNDPLLNLAILRHFEKDGDDLYNDGEIYDPKNGKTYSCKITHKGETLSVRGFVGVSLIGRTTVWERAK